MSEIYKSVGEKWHRQEIKIDIKKGNTHGVAEGNINTQTHMHINTNICTDAHSHRGKISRRWLGILKSAKWKMKWRCGGETRKHNRQVTHFREHKQSSA